MIDPFLRQAMEKELERIPPEAQRRVLEFARGQEPAKQGEPGKALLLFAGVFDPVTLDEMQRAIKSSCEQVAPRDW